MALFMPPMIPHNSPFGYPDSAKDQLNGGIFDKFTGDGALVHFLEKECKLVYDRKPVDAALSCAVDMHRAIEIHLERLRKFLRLNSELIGASIAIDISDAFWSLDHRDNPITVGRGVVGACRLCDSASAGVVRMTNIAYQELSSSIILKLPEVREEHFSSKELKEEMKVTVWEFAIPPSPQELGVGHPLNEIDALCQRIYKVSDSAENHGLK
jgi:class 3 adenylate cyclase